MAKKKLKTYNQIQKLELYLQQRPNKWPKNQLIKLAKDTNLSRQQVYKWLWDRRNLAKETHKRQQEMPKTNHYMNCLELSDGDSHLRPKPQVCHSYRKISFRGRKQYYKFFVPERLEFADRIRIPKSTGYLFKRILKDYGCELTRMKKEIHFDTPQKKPRFIEVNEFQARPEEKYPSRI